MCAFRLARHGLTDPWSPPATGAVAGDPAAAGAVAGGPAAGAGGQAAHGDGPAAVASRICGVHAQVMPSAEVAVGIRTRACARADVRAALWETGTLVKTYGPRGTVHLFPAAELPMWNAALAEVARPERQPPEIRTTPTRLDAVVDAIGAALSTAPDLTVDELDPLVVAATGPWAADRVVPAFGGEAAPRWRAAIGVAAHRGVLCFGPGRGRVTTYAGVRRRLPDYRPVPGAPALAEVARRYLRGYGPATAYQFARWFGMARPAATALFETLAGELAPVEVAGSGRAYVLDGDADLAAPPPPGALLLPYFDGYVVGAHPRELLFPGPAAQRATQRGSAGNVPVLLLDGVVAGVWHQARSGRRIVVTVEAFGPVSARQRRELDERAARLGEIQDGDVVLGYGPVTAGRHL